jgi:hypothetical protein
MDTELMELYQRCFPGTLLVVSISFYTSCRPSTNVRRTLLQEVLDLVRVEVAHGDMAFCWPRGLTRACSFALASPSIARLRRARLMSRVVLGGGARARRAVLVAFLVVTVPLLSRPPPAIHRVSKQASKHAPRLSHRFSPAPLIFANVKSGSERAGCGVEI